MSFPTPLRRASRLTICLLVAFSLPQCYSHRLRAVLYNQAPNATVELQDGSLFPPPGGLLLSTESGQAGQVGAFVPKPERDDFRTGAAYEKARRSVQWDFGFQDFRMKQKEKFENDIYYLMPFTDAHYSNLAKPYNVQRLAFDETEFIDNRPFLAPRGTGDVAGTDKVKTLLFKSFSFVAQGLRVDNLVKLNLYVGHLNNRWIEDKFHFYACRLPKAQDNGWYLYLEGLHIDEKLQCLKISLWWDRNIPDYLNDDKKQAVMDVIEDPKTLQERKEKEHEEAIGELDDALGGDRKKKLQEKKEKLRKMPTFDERNDAPPAESRVPGEPNSLSGTQAVQNGGGSIVNAPNNADALDRLVQITNPQPMVQENPAQLPDKEQPMEVEHEAAPEKEAPQGIAEDPIMRGEVPGEFLKFADKFKEFPADFDGVNFKREDAAVKLEDAPVKLEEEVPVVLDDDNDNRKKRMEKQKKGDIKQGPVKVEDQQGYVSSKVAPQRINEAVGNSGLIEGFRAPQPRVPSFPKMEVEEPQPRANPPTRDIGIVSERQVNAEKAALQERRNREREQRQDQGLEGLEGWRPKQVKPDRVTGSDADDYFFDNDGNWIPPRLPDVRLDVKHAKQCKCTGCGMQDFAQAKYRMERVQHVGKEPESFRIRGSNSFWERPQVPRAEPVRQERPVLEMMHPLPTEPMQETLPTPQMPPMQSMRETFPNPPPDPLSLSKPKAGEDDNHAPGYCERCLQCIGTIEDYENALDMALKGDYSKLLKYENGEYHYGVQPSVAQPGANNDACDCSHCKPGKAQEGRKDDRMPSAPLVTQGLWGPRATQIPAPAPILGNQAPVACGKCNDCLRRKTEAKVRPAIDPWDQQPRDPRTVPTTVAVPPPKPVTNCGKCKTCVDRAINAYNNRPDRERCVCLECDENRSRRRLEDQGKLPPPRLHKGKHKDARGYDKEAQWIHLQGKYRPDFDPKDWVPNPIPEYWDYADPGDEMYHVDWLEESYDKVRKTEFWKERHKVAVPRPESVFEEARQDIPMMRFAQTLRDRNADDHPQAQQSAPRVEPVPPRTVRGLLPPPSQFVQDQATYAPVNYQRPEQYGHKSSKGKPPGKGNNKQG